MTDLHLSGVRTSYLHVHPRAQKSSPVLRRIWKKDPDAQLTALGL